MGWRSSARALARIAARPVSAAVDGLDAQTAVAHGTVLCERPPRATDDDGGATFTKKSRQRSLDIWGAGCMVGVPRVVRELSLGAGRRIRNHDLLKGLIWLYRMN
jgi:hypothetical protein